MSEAEKCKLCGVKKISHYGPGPRQRLGLYCYGSCHELSEQVYEPAEPAPAPPAQGPEMHHSRDNSPQPLDTKEKSMQDLYAQDADGFWIRREKPDYAERVIEVAPQGEIPDTVILTGEQFREMQAALTAAREERDRWQALSELNETVRNVLTEARKKAEEERDRAHEALRDIYGPGS